MDNGQYGSMPVSKEKRRGREDTVRGSFIDCGNVIPDSLNSVNTMV